MILLVFKLSYKFYFFAASHFYWPSMLLLESRNLTTLLCSYLDGWFRFSVYVDWGNIDYLYSESAHLFLWCYPVCNVLMSSAREMCYCSLLPHTKLWVSLKGPLDLSYQDMGKKALHPLHDLILTWALWLSLRFWGYTEQVVFYEKVREGLPPYPLGHVLPTIWRI